MGNFQGRISAIQLDERGQASARVACPVGAVPAPGQYLLATLSEDPAASLPIPLFPSQISTDGFIAPAPLPPAWGPGLALHLRGPLGRGFQLHIPARRLALVAIGAGDGSGHPTAGSSFARGSTFARLLPLVRPALERGAGVALFGDCPLPSLPTSVEAYPLESLPEALAWADYLAFDLSLDALPLLRRFAHLKPGAALPCPAEALLTTAMPCGGLGECGACAVLGRRGYRLVCKDGPVLDLREIEW